MRGKRQRLPVPDRIGRSLARMAGPPPWRVLVALSGGADSSGLLAALVALTESSPDGPRGPEVLTSKELRISACHVNHGARGREDGQAEEFCEELCGTLGVPLVQERVTVKAAGRGFEDAARVVRYSTLEAARREGRAQWILTAHTADDVAETVLWRLARGASSRGLGGIPERTDHVLRPALEVRREELRDWLAVFEPVAGLVAEDRPHPWVEDSTNRDPAFLRNRMRHEVLPPLCEAVPQAVESIGLAAKFLRDDGEYLDARAREALLKARSGNNCYSVQGLAELPPPIARRAIRVALLAAGVPGDEVNSRHLILLLDGLTHDGFGMDLPGGVKVQVKKGLLRASRR